MKRTSVTALWSVQRPTGTSYRGDDFRRAYEDWEAAHMLGLNAIRGTLCRSFSIRVGGWELRTPWWVYARTPATERYRREATP